MTARRLPGPVLDLDARVEVPSSKSLTNRALIAAAAAGGGTIRRPLDCEDTRLLADALRQAGWAVEWADDIALGTRHPVARAEVGLGNSGTGSRLILGLLACVPGSFRVDGTPRLRERPMAPLIDALRELGSRVDSDVGRLPVEIEGRQLAGGFLQIRPEVSSQFVSSLLLVAPLMSHGLELEVLGQVPSRPYLDLTERVLVTFGARVSRTGGERWRVAAGGLRPTSFEVEGDWSAAAFPVAAAAVAGGRVSIGRLEGSSSQGDRAICDILQPAGLRFGFSEGALTAVGPVTRPFEVDVTATPDLFPALVVVASSGPEGTVLRGLDNLRHKESDRLAVMVDNLRRLGADFEEGPSFIRVTRGMRRGRADGTAVTAAGDHRIAMAMAVAGLAVGGLELDDPSCVGKSFPAFWDMWEHLLQGAGASS